jgi:hypothetical protein
VWPWKRLARTPNDRCLCSHAREAAQRSGNPATIGFITVFAGRAEAYGDRLDDARQSFDEAIAAYEALGDGRQALVARSDLAHTLRRGGALDEAEGLYRETMVEWRHLGQRGAIANQIESFAFLARARGDARRAAVLFGAAERLRDRAPAPMAAYERPEYEKEVGLVRDGLSDAEFSEAWAEGAALSMDQAVGLAMAGEPGRPGG